MKEELRKTNCVTKGDILAWEDEALEPDFEQAPKKVNPTGFRRLAMAARPPSGRTGFGFNRDRRGSAGCTSDLHHAEVGRKSKPETTQADAKDGEPNKDYRDVLPNCGSIGREKLKRKKKKTRRGKTKTKQRLHGQPGKSICRFMGRIPKQS